MSERGARAPVRALLHHQGAGQGHRPGAGHRLRHREAEPAASSTCVSEPGLGTTIRIYLPRRIGEPSAPEPKAPAPRASARRWRDPAGGRGRTLGPAADARGSSPSLNYRVLAAQTPAEALRVAEAAPGEIALLITDVIMPEMNGRNWRSGCSPLRPELKTLFMSGLRGRGHLRTGVLDSGSAFLQKPFTAADLAASCQGGARART